MDRCGRRWSSRTWVASFFLVMASSASAADPAPDSSVQLSPVLVSPRRIPGLFVDADAVPANATVITEEEIREANVSTVPELLSRVEGIIVLDTHGFGMGSDGTVNLRGVVNSSRSNVLVLVDGVRQNRITGDEVHWQSLPMAAIERIEILRGGGGTIYGEGAFAGVINLMTKRGGAKHLETEESVELGSFGWQQYAVSARGRLEPLTYGVTYTRRLLDGYREFSNSRNTTITTHHGLELGDTARLEVNVLHRDVRINAPGGRTLPQIEQDRRGATIGNVVLFDDETDQVSSDLILGPWEGWSAVFNMFWRERVSDSLRSGLFTITPSEGLSLRTNHEYRGVNAVNTLISGIELIDDKATTGTHGSPPDSESNREGYGLYVEDTITWRDRLSLVGGLRFDKSRFEEALTFPSFTGTLRFEGWSPKLGLTYEAIKDRLDLFASYSRPFKAPNVDDFSAQVADFVGNISLEPQQADTYEVGARINHAPWSAAATGFYLKTEDEILFNRLEGLFGQNQNFDTRRFGVELSGRFEVPQRLRLVTTYTFVDAEFDKGQFTGRTIPATPEHTLNLSAGVSPLPRCWITLEWQLVHDYFRINDFNNVLAADNFGVLDLTLEYRHPNPDLRAFLTIKNITGEEYVAFQSSNASNLTGAGENPMPPIHVIFGISFKF